ncbi:LLM class flavin-dependent oxidoreductase [Streptomyces sp. SID3343]|uniref:LLM class flavin-dependent oxidoreductase n=1 Tax=Streptomyces sp. SID3343 TaxID=2690260 RepID=UPI00136D49F0|nr:LLM class flavin-dependent oxidoreductase [Streptomyces sp. SID3343]MYW04194.1 LLM class flavin-dependent oxidoreductase [Streptomyces sp. SID3343]
MVNVGIYLDLRNPVEWRQDWARLYGFTLELCEEADRLGVHSIWTTEHHGFDDGYLSQPLTMAAAIAARTKQARIGTGVTVAPLRHPVHLAEEAAIVDLVSGGRLELGIGTGYRLPEYELFDRADAFKTRFSATDASAREIRRLWDTAAINPPPVQERPRIWLGYQGPQGARRAGLLGESLLTANPEMAAPYLDALREGGHDVATARMAGVLNGWISDDPERDWPLVSRHLSHQWDSYHRYAAEGTGAEPPRPIDAERWRARGLSSAPGHFLHATPEDAARDIKAYVAGTPIETVVFFASLSGMPEDAVRRHVTTLCTRLAPLLG